MYPSTYGEPFVPTEDRVLPHLERMGGICEQGDLHWSLAGGMHSNDHRTYREICGELRKQGSLSMVWRADGMPYYLTPALRAELEPLVVMTPTGHDDERVPVVRGYEFPARKWLPNPDA